MVIELMCPACRSELLQVGDRHYHCPGCKATYKGEIVKPNIDEMGVIN